ncbi:hypothetical protein HHI36_004506 [Cryptolaemus montrouzieri]|uniref:Uncharacterized protein n=1 Tax=Cryptolaemus montrouzieri TaxID=559131 RepID=A0ABD2NRD5_9CUCU
MILLLFLLFSCVWGEKHVCEMSACESLKEGKLFAEEFGYELVENITKTYITKLERRIRSLEQPVWSMSKEDDRWLECSKGPCECTPETKSISCWQRNLPSLPFEQIIPHDAYVIDLGINKLTTINKDAFKHLLFLTELDLFDNELDYLPESIFDDLENLKYLRLHKNFLADLHKNIFWGLRNIKTLDISFNRLTDLPEDIFTVCQDIVMLHLSGNRLKNLPEQLLRNMKYLEDLDISNNEVGNVPLEIFKELSSLRRLNLADNELKELEKEYLMIWLIWNI